MLRAWVGCTARQGRHVRGRDAGAEPGPEDGTGGGADHDVGAAETSPASVSPASTPVNQAPPTGPLPAPALTPGQFGEVLRDLGPHKRR